MAQAVNTTSNGALVHQDCSGYAVGFDPHNFRNSLVWVDIFEVMAVHLTSCQSTSNVLERCHLSANPEQTLGSKKDCKSADSKC